MGEGVNKINPFLNKVPNITNSGDSKKNTPSVDLSKLPEGVSKYDIDGFQVTLYKKGSNIQTQIVGNGDISVNEVHEKIKKQLDSQSEQ